MMVDFRIEKQYANPDILDKSYKENSDWGDGSCMQDSKQIEYCEKFTARVEVVGQYRIADCGIGPKLQFQNGLRRIYCFLRKTCPGCLNWHKSTTAFQYGNQQSSGARLLALIKNVSHSS
jgi:hypothetical protein